MIKYIFSYSIFLLLILTSARLYSQDNLTISRVNLDTSAKLNMDAIYNRPFLTANKLPIAIGGYIEANSEYQSTNGVDEGFDFQMRRMTLFFSSTVAQRIKFLAEIELEHGTKEINLETALVDFEIHPMAVLRGGILLNPIGGFNQNHDGPRWDFIDRPIASTEIIPSTLSNVGMGLYGKYFYHQWTFGYEAYLTNGLNENLILNEANRTSFKESKEGTNKFSKSHSGLPMFTGKMAIRNRQFGEIGVSYLTGVYNLWKNAGNIIDDKRSASLFAIDFNTSLLKNKISINGEWVKSFVQLPNYYVQTYGSEQMGFYCDVIYTIMQNKIFGWEKAKLNLGLRLDYTDYNQDEERNSGDKLFDDTWAITTSLALRPTGTTALRLNYKYLEMTDIFGNLPSKTGTIQFGMTAYF